MRLNNKGDTGNQMMSLFYVFLMLVVAVGLSTGIFIFFGAEYQFKQIDADEMYLKVSDCVLQNSLGEIGNNFYSVCGINKPVAEKYFRVKICVNGNSDCVVSDSSLFVLGSDFQSCVLKGIKDNSNFPRCVNGFVKKGSDNVEIIAGSQQKIRRIA